MSFDSEKYYDFFDAQLGITKKQKDAQLAQTRKILDKRRAQFMANYPDQSMDGSEESSPIVSMITPIVSKPVEQKRDQSPLWNSTATSTPQLNLNLNNEIAKSKSYAKGEQLHLNNLNSNITYNYRDHLSDKAKKEKRLSSQPVASQPMAAVEPLNGRDSLVDAPKSVKQDSSMRLRMVGTLRKDNSKEHETQEALRSYRVDSKLNGFSFDSSSAMRNVEDSHMHKSASTHVVKPYMKDIDMNSIDARSLLSPTELQGIDEYLTSINNDEAKSEENFDVKGKKDNFVEIDNDGYDIGKAVAYLRSEAKPQSIRKCATYVRKAIEAGGVETNGRPESAKDYDSYLPSIGFRKLDAQTYKPRVGDIIVHEAQDGHKDGHIAMYDGNVWISDFVQSDMYGGRKYREEPNYTLWRR